MSPSAVEHDPVDFYTSRRLQAQTDLAYEARPHWRRVHEATIAACDVELNSLTNEQRRTRQGAPFCAIK